VSSQEALAREYIAALTAYLEKGDEASLSHAYELGRRAMFEGLGVMDMALLHERALEAVVLPPAADKQLRLAAAAGHFFRELLSPYEMTLRGYREANERLRQLNENLREQKESVETLNRELESFSYSVSHDLRAPLRSIDGFSHALSEDYADKLDKKGQSYLRYVRESAQRMAQLIDDLLGLARVARSERRQEDVDLSAMARRIADRLQAAAPERQVAFVIQDAVRCTGDSRLMTVLLENLLGNAFKFTSKKDMAEIEFGRQEMNGTAVYFVRDNGAGFDMTFADKLFGAFQRLHSADEFEGTGIGLATVQRVVSRHAGQVWAEARVGHGATFYFTLGSSKPAG